MSYGIDWLYHKEPQSRHRLGYRQRQGLTKKKHIFMNLIINI